MDLMIIGKDIFSAIQVTGDGSLLIAGRKRDPILLVSVHSEVAVNLRYEQYT